MKKLHKLVFSIVASALCVGGFLATQNNKNNVQEVGASLAHHSTGFYKKITSPSELEDDDQVIITEGSYKGMSRFPGLYAALVSSDTNFYYSNDLSYLGVEDSDATEYTVVKVGENFMFKGFMEIGDNDHCYEVYLAYNNDTSIKYFSGVTLNGFYDYFGAYPATTSSGDNFTKSKWGLSPISDSNNVSIQLTNCFQTDWGKSVNIYKKINSQEIYPAIYSLNQKDYYYGDSIDLRGYYIFFQYGNDVCDIYYENAKDLFYIDNPIVRKNEQGNPVLSYDLSVRGTGHNNFNAYINTPTENPNYVFTQINSNDLKDYRGSYLLVAKDSKKYFDGGEDGGFGTSKNCTITNNQITLANLAMTNEVIQIERHIIDNQSIYVGKAPNGKYFKYRDYHTFLEYSDTVTMANALTIFENADNKGITIAFFRNPNVYFQFADTGDGKFAFQRDDLTHENARLFKIGSTAESNADISSFKNTFFDLTSVCDETGKTNKITNEIWTSLSNAFASLGADAQGYFANLTYTHGDTTPGSDEDLVDRYDYIVDKYNKDDFMLRKLAGTYESNFSNNKANTQVAFNNTNSANMIIVIAIISVTSLSLVLLICKKRSKVSK